MRFSERNRREIFRLCHSGLDTHTLRVELLQRLRADVAFDYAYFSTTDPMTQFGVSFVLAEEPPAWLMTVFVENEFLQEDYNKFGDMIKSRQLVAVLSQATRHELHRSQRYRDMLLPLQMGDELRAIFLTDAACWGTLCLHRASAKIGYTREEADFIAQLAPHIAAGLRKGMLLAGAPTSDAPDGPGVLILAEDLSVVAVTSAAERWLRELNETERTDAHSLPLSVRGVVAKLQAIERGQGMADMPSVRVRTRSGHWLAIHASRLMGAGDTLQFSIVIEAAQPAEIAPLVMQAYQLTKREGEITQCVLRGWSTQEIASALSIAPTTVQDHLKAIFGKVDVSSRRELAARLFTRHYQR